MAGNLLVAGIRRVVPEGAVRRLSVRALAGGIVLGRSTERAMEEARLLAADLMAEAQASLGEESQPTETAHEAHGH